MSLPQLVQPALSSHKVKMQSYITHLGKVKEFVKVDDFIWILPALVGVIAFLFVSAFGCRLVWV